MKSKYPKTTGHYVYKHILPNAMYYPGMSKQQPCDRWKPSSYKTTVLGPYIKQYGWDNIEHVIIADGLTEDEARKLENQLIQEGKKDGLCINKNDSGGKWRDNPKQYHREYEQRPEVKQYHREYEKTEKRKEYEKKRRQTEKRKEYQREWLRQNRLKKKALK